MSEKKNQGGFAGFKFRLPDDRRSFWVYLPVAALIAAVFVGVLDHPNGDTKVQALSVLGLAEVSLLISWYWAISLQRASVSPVNYVKGTTTSRTVVWFWAIFGGLSVASSITGIGGQSFVPIWESTIWTFAGLGSVLLTAGPGYKEYREAMGTIDAYGESAVKPAAAFDMTSAEQMPAVPRTRSLPVALFVLISVAGVLIRRVSRDGSGNRARQDRVTSLK